MTSADDQSFLRAFQECSLPSLSHHAHLRLTWILLQREPLTSAIETLRRGFSAFAESKGKPQLYHETITWAFILLVNERIQRGQGGATWQEFITLNSDLARGLVALEAWYDSQTLHSELARRTFLLPDRGHNRQPLS